MHWAEGRLLGTTISCAWTTRVPFHSYRFRCTLVFVFGLFFSHHVVVFFFVFSGGDQVHEEKDGFLEARVTAAVLRKQAIHLGLQIKGIQCTFGARCWLPRTVCFHAFLCNVSNPELHGNTFFWLPSGLPLFEGP